MKKNEQRPNRSMEGMRPHIKEWADSGKTKKLFCKERGIAPSVFYYWCRKYEEESQPGGFVPVDLSHTHEPAGRIEIKYPNGNILMLPPGTSPSVVRQYVYL